jgi:hypothetical protein
MMLYNMLMIIVMHIIHHLLLGRPVLPPPLGLQLLLRLGQARQPRAGGGSSRLSLRGRRDRPVVGGGLRNGKRNKETSMSEYYYMSNTKMLIDALCSLIHVSLIYI